MELNQKKVVPTVDDRYEIMYTILVNVNKCGGQVLSDYVTKSQSDENIKASLLYINSCGWFDGLPNLDIDITGQINTTLSSNIFVTTDGLRFIYFYENYKDKDYDIISMVRGDSQLIRYFENQNKYAFWKSIITNVIVIFLTAFFTAYFS